jgi:hypothetical protein
MRVSQHDQINSISDLRPLLSTALLLDDAEDFFFAHDQELFTVDLDLGA